VSLIGFSGDASWTGYALIAGHWYSGAGQADVNTAFLTQTGTKVGDSYTLTSGNRHLTIQIAGEIFDPSGGVPPSVLNVYNPWELVLLALSGLAIAVAGALLPAGWAARTRTAFALRAE
jgi:hypothetical protein